jgi:hypothetical protein
MSNTQAEVESTFSLFMKEGRRLARAHGGPSVATGQESVESFQTRDTCKEVESNALRINEERRRGQALCFLPLARDSVEAFKIQVTEVGGGRPSPRDRERVGCKSDGLPVQNIEEVMEAINCLMDLARENEEVIDDELLEWMAELVRVQVEGKEPEEVHVEGTEEEQADSQPSTCSSDLDFPGLYEEGDNPYMDGWLENIYLLDHGAKCNGNTFIGGADDVNDAFTSIHCPHCNKPVGDETDQHVAKCKYAHEEQEKLSWAMRRVERSKGRGV